MAIDPGVDKFCNKCNKTTKHSTLKMQCYEHPHRIATEVVDRASIYCFNAETGKALEIGDDPLTEKPAKGEVIIDSGNVEWVVIHITHEIIGTHQISVYCQTLTSYNAR